MPAVADEDLHPAERSWRCARPSANMAILRHTSGLPRTACTAGRPPTGTGWSSPAITRSNTALARMVAEFGY
jgi:hypothetical protein